MEKPSNHLRIGVTAQESRSIRKKMAGRGWQFWLGGLLSLVSLGWLIVTTDWPAAWSALLATDYRLVAAAALLNLLLIPLRALRWRVIFPAGRRPPFSRLTVAMLIGQAVNLLAPARLGELVQAGLVPGEHLAYVLGTQTLRMVLDLMMMGFLVIGMMFQAGLPDWWRRPGELLLFIAAAAVVATAGLFLARRPVLRLLAWLERRWSRPAGQRLLVAARAFVDSLESLANPAIMVSAVALTLLMWILYASVNNVLLGAVGQPYSWLAALFVLLVMIVGAFLPSAPGRVGVYHYLGVQALLALGIDRATAVTYAILLHLITVVMPVILAALLAWQMGISWRPASQAAGQAAPVADDG